MTGNPVYCDRCGHHRSLHTRSWDNPEPRCEVPDCTCGRAACCDPTDPRWQPAPIRAEHPTVGPQRRDRAPRTLGRTR